MIQLQIKLGKTCTNHYNIDWSCLSVIPMTGTTSGHPYDPLAEILRWRRWSQERAWADPRSCSAPCRLETWLWCWPSTLYPSWLKTTWTNQIKKKKNSGLDKLKGFAWICLLTCNIYFSVGQRGQVRRGESVKAPSIHLGHAISSVEFVVKIQAYLSREADVLLKRAKTWHLFNINTGNESII